MDLPNYKITKSCNDLCNKSSLVLIDDKKTYITFNNKIYLHYGHINSIHHTSPYKITAISKSSYGTNEGIVCINQTFHKISTKKISNVLENSEKIFFTSSTELIIYDKIAEIFKRIEVNSVINTIAIDDKIYLGCSNKNLKVYDEVLVENIPFLEEIQQLIVEDEVYIFFRNHFLLKNKNLEVALEKITKAFFKDKLFILTSNGLFTYETNLNSDCALNCIYKKKNNFFNFFINEEIVLMGNNELNFLESKSFISYLPIKSMKVTDNLLVANDFCLNEYSLDLHLLNKVEFKERILEYFSNLNFYFVLTEKSFLVVKKINKEVLIRKEIEATNVLVMPNEIIFTFKNELRFFSFGGEGFDWENFLENVTDNSVEKDEENLAENSSKKNKSSSQNSLQKDEENIKNSVENSSKKNKNLGENILQETKTVDLKDEIYAIKAAPNYKFWAVSTGHNIIVFRKHKKILKLYGFNLQIKDFQFTFDDRIITYSMDKRIKIFGLNFGECIKSILVVDAKEDGSLAVLDSQNFFLSSKKLFQFFKFDLVNTFENKCILIAHKNGKVYGSDGNSIDLYEESEYLEQSYFSNINNQSSFEKFCLAIESNNLDVNFTDLDLLIEQLNVQQLNLLINQINKINNLVVKVRVINCIFKVNKSILIGNEGFKSEFKNVLGQFNEIRKGVTKYFYLNK